MSRLCDYCECVNINGTRCHETGCQNEGEKIRLLDDGTLDTVFECGKCREQFRFTFDPTACEGDCTEECTETECGNYENFRFECLKELQNEHECFACEECGTVHDSENGAVICCQFDEGLEKLENGIYECPSCEESYDTESEAWDCCHRDGDTYRCTECGRDYERAVDAVKCCQHIEACDDCGLTHQKGDESAMPDCLAYIEDSFKHRG